MPRNVPQVNLTLQGKDGYNNAINILNTISSIYLNPTYGASARSLTGEDVNKVENHTPNGNVDSQTWNHRYGLDLTTLDITDTGSDSNKPSQTYTSTATTGYEFYYLEKFIEMDCWLATRSIGVSSSDCDFRVNSLDTELGAVYCNYLFYITPDGNSDDGDSSYPVVPVITLKPEVQLNLESEFYTQEENGYSDANSTSVQTGTNQYGHHAWIIQ